MRNKTLLTSILFGVVLVLSPAGPAAAGPQLSDAAKIQQMLASCGHAYQVISSDVWLVPYSGRHLAKFNILIGAEQGKMVVGVVLAEKKIMNLNADMMHRMLLLNHQLELVKVGLDGDGDAFLRAELFVRVLDARELKDVIEQVGTSTDEAYGILLPFLSVSPKPSN